MEIKCKEADLVTFLLGFPTALLYRGFRKAIPLLNSHSCPFPLSATRQRKSCEVWWINIERAIF
jgi:hypothetical protein